MSKQEDLNNPHDNGYDSDYNVEIIDSSGNIHVTKYRPFYNNIKRLLCASYMSDYNCKYGSACTYAHDYIDQSIDDDKIELYRILFDKQYLLDSLNSSGDSLDLLYKSILYLTNECNNCRDGNCSGGYNCKYGVTKKCMKLCKHDFLSGECENETREILIDKDIKLKMNEYGIKCDNIFIGCDNGIHITVNGLLPYYVYIHRSDNVEIVSYNSSRKIDLDYLYKYFMPDNMVDNVIVNIFDNDSDSSYDEICDIIDSLENSDSD